MEAAANCPPPSPLTAYCINSGRVWAWSTEEEAGRMFAIQMGSVRTLVPYRFAVRGS